METEDYVLRLHAPEEVLEEEPGDPEDVRAVLYTRGLPSVTGRVGDVEHPESPHVKLYQEIVAVPVSGIYSIEPDPLQGPA